jgi:hypothetical protein
MSSSVISGMGELTKISLQRKEFAQDNLQVEDNREREHEASDSKVDPLDILQRFRIVPSLQEEHIGAQNWRYNGANAVESLRDVDSQLCIPRRTTDSDVWVGCCLQGAQSIADDEDGRAKSSK